MIALMDITTSHASLTPASVSSQLCENITFPNSGELGHACKSSSHSCQTSDPAPWQHASRVKTRLVVGMAPTRGTEEQSGQFTASGWTQGPETKNHVWKRYVLKHSNIIYIYIYILFDCLCPRNRPTFLWLAGKGTTLVWIYWQRYFKCFQWCEKMFL